MLYLNFEINREGFGCATKKLTLFSPFNCNTYTGLLGVLNVPKAISR